MDPSINDLMSYCFSEPSRWISDYYFTNSLRYRLFDEGAGGECGYRCPHALAPALGGCRANSVPYLEPAVVVDAATVLPDSAGPFGSPDGPAMQPSFSRSASTCPRRPTATGLVFRFRFSP